MAAQRFVDLAPLNDGERAAASCAAVLGIREEGDRPLMELLLEHLAARRTLLLLDNCEHVIDGVVALVDAVLRGSTGTTAMATSLGELRRALETRDLPTDRSTGSGRDCPSRPHQEADGRLGSCAATP